MSDNVEHRKSRKSNKNRDESFQASKIKQIDDIQMFDEDVNNDEIDVNDMYRAMERRLLDINHEIQELEDLKLRLEAGYKRKSLDLDRINQKIKKRQSEIAEGKPIQELKQGIINLKQDKKRIDVQSSLISTILFSSECHEIRQKHNKSTTV